VPLAALVLALALPPLVPDLPVAGQRALLVMLIAIVLWTSERLEPGVTALLAVALLPLTGATTTMRAALQGFANPVPYFLVGVLTMGAAVVKSGLALAVMMTGDAVVYYPAQSSSALVIYERGHVSAGEIFRFGLWMTLLGWVTVLLVALPWWSLVGQPLVQR